MFNCAETSWFGNGLRFECAACGNCCSGPGEGYIWVSDAEVKFIADFLKMPVKKLQQNYLRRVKLRMSILEQPDTKDCIFLQKIGSEKKCVIYPVRPNQCRTWPFWTENLTATESWIRASQRCPGINRGKFYTFEKIAKIVECEKWWDNDPKSPTA